MSEPEKTLVVIATYNERENLPGLVEAIFQAAPQVQILVVDDNSPDGTGQWCDEAAAQDERITCLHRAGKLGLGTAIIAGLRHSIDQGYTYVINLDADFSHHPKYLPALLAGMKGGAVGPSVDVMIGSRYVEGGGVEGWPLGRRVMSRGVNLLARGLLSLPVRDCSGSFRCYRVAKLQDLDLDAITARGYSMLEEILWRLQRSGARFGETPIVFADRRHGQSKINSREAAAALWTLARLGTRNWTGL